MRQKGPLTLKFFIFCHIFLLQRERMLASVHNLHHGYFAFQEITSIVSTKAPSYLKYIVSSDQLGSPMFIFLNKNTTCNKNDFILLSNRCWNEQKCKLLKFQGQLFSTSVWHCLKWIMQLFKGMGLLSKHGWTSTEKLLKFLTGWVHFVMYLNITKYRIFTKRHCIKFKLKQSKSLHYWQIKKVFFV